MNIVANIIFFINLLFFIISYFFYRKYQCINEEIQNYPYVTVIIPAYNEGICVAETIASVQKSDYDKDKLEIVVVNDGSTDNTNEIICQSIQDTNIKYLDLKCNKGKRNAIYQATRIARGDVIVTVDSDSIIKKNTIRNIVKPFVKDKYVGAVAGNILIKNRKSIIPYMLSASFLFGFKFLRGSQSVFKCVLCTPGALSAYKKSVIIDELYKWSKQIFFGKRANIGEDRALTSIVLKKNYKVVYQENAVCYTNVPDKFYNLIKMYIRWIRGDIRESFILFYFLKNIKIKWNFNIFGLIYNVFMQFVWILSSFMIFYYLILCFLGTYNFLVLILITIIFTTFWSILPCYICYKYEGIKTAFYCYLYCYLNVFALFWLIPYCCITISNSGWLTRNKK